MKALRSYVLVLTFLKYSFSIILKETKKTYDPKASLYFDFPTSGSD